MKRRNFLSTLFGLVVAPTVIVKALSAAPGGLVLQSYPITPKVRKLKSTWSAEKEQKLCNMMASEIQREIDREILKSMERAV